MNTRVRLRDQLLEGLANEQKKRNKRDDWHFQEQLYMLSQVNERRHAIGKGPVCMLNIEEVEQLAVGHSDYSSKFVLYCAELILEHP